MSYNDKSGVWDAEGDVVISRGGITLYSQKAAYNNETGIAEVEGDVRLKSGEDILSGDRGVYNFKDQTGTIINGRLFMKENNFHAQGDLMEKLGENTYQLKDCVLTTCDGENPVWRITGSEINVTIEGYGTVKHATLWIHDVPVLYLPYMIFPAKTKRQSGLLPPRIGHGSRNGLDVELPFFWALSEQTDITLYQRYLSERGYMQGLEFRYILDPESKGNFLFDILSDWENKDMNDPDDANISPLSRTNDTRYWFRGKTDHKLPKGITLHLDADFMSDQDYLEEFQSQTGGSGVRPNLQKKTGRPVEEKRSPIRTSAVRLSRDEENFSLQGGGSFHQLPGDPVRHETAQPLAGLFFSILPTGVSELPFPAFFDLDSEYDYVWRDHGQKGHRTSISSGLRFPLHFAEYVQFEPSIRYILSPQWFEKAEGGNHEQTLHTFEIGGTLSTTLDRIFDKPVMGAKRLKHRIRPSVSYIYRHFSDSEEKAPTPWFEPTIAENDTNLVTLGIENFLDARIEDEQGNVRYRQWAKMTLTQGYDIQEKRRDSITRDREPFGPLNMELTVTPFPNLNLFSQVAWDHYDQQITFADLSLSLITPRSGNRKDRFQMDYLYEIENDAIDDHESLNFWFDVNVVGGLTVGSSFEKDMNHSHDISNRYWLQFQGQCWGVKVIAEKENDETSLMLEFQLRGLADIGPD